MTTRTYISALVSIIVNAVLFGVGAIVVLTIPALEAEAAYWLPLVVIVSFFAAPIIGWMLAPSLTARWEGEQPNRSRAPRPRV